MAAKTHGHSVHRTHTPTYSSWASMIKRCTNPGQKRYERYGGRGIAVCPAWRSFEAFLADMGERPSLAYSLDRVNNDGNYEPGNCRWATAKQQAQNRRKRVVVRKPNCARGEMHRSAKLTDELVIRILDLLAAGRSRRTLAREFSVAPATISGIAWGHTWTHVPRPFAAVHRIRFEAALSQPRTVREWAKVET